MRRVIVIAARAGVKDRDGWLLTKRNFKTLDFFILFSIMIKQQVALKQKMRRRSLKRSAE